MDQHRYDKLSELTKSNVQGYVNSFKVSDDIKIIDNKYKDIESEKLLEGKIRVTVAGRIMAMRSFGKAAFATIRDRTGKIQTYIKKNDLTEEEYETFKKTDVGDFIGITGYLFKTKTGELTVYAEKYTLLTKALRDLPEKFHGLKDIETRLRQRYVDLIVNENVNEIFIKRSLIVREIRNFFNNKDFMEVETPMMHPIVGGASAKPFVTHHNALDMELFLRIAPELYLKRLVIGGLERVFEINRSFRNEGVSTKHNPEFTMIEWYMAYADYHDLMDMTEELIKSLSMKVNGTTTIEYGDHQIDLSKKWARLTMEEAITKYSDIKKEILIDIDSATKLAKSLGISIDKKWGLGKIVLEIFDIVAEHKLIQPTFIVDYPKEVSPLAKSKKDNPEVTERFELFVAGFELANGFNELNNPIDQKERFEKQVADRESGDEEAQMMDKDYIRALEYGLPPTAGEGLGIDRLVMLLTNSSTIREVLLFPHMKPEDTVTTGE